MPTVRMAEKLRISEFHMLEIDVTYSDAEVAELADEAKVAGKGAMTLSRSVELTLYEERRILVAAAIRSGLLDLETGKAILLAWKPKDAF